MTERGSPLYCCFRLSWNCFMFDQECSATVVNGWHPPFKFTRTELMKHGMYIHQSVSSRNLADAKSKVMIRIPPCYRDKLWSCCSSQIPLVWYQWWFKAKKSKECFCEDLLKVYLFHSVAMDCMWKSQYTKLMIGETCWSVVMTADHCCMEVSP